MAPKVIDTINEYFHGNLLRILNTVKWRGSPRCGTYRFNDRTKVLCDRSGIYAELSAKAIVGS